MKYITHIQKKIIGFKPDTHWKMILTITFFLISFGVVYNIYIYIYAMQQIEVTASSTVPTRITTTATSTTDVNIEDLFEVYKDREILYTSIIQTLSRNNAIVSSSSSSTTDALATSSKQ